MSRQVFITSNIPIVVTNDAAAELLIEDFIDILQDSGTFICETFGHAIDRKEKNMCKFIYTVIIEEIK